MKQICSLLPLTVVLLAACAGGSNVDGAAIVALSKAATGGPEWDRIVVWHETGTGYARGNQTVHYQHWEEFRSLATRNAGDFPGRYMVFDGQVAYACMNAGCTHLGDRDAAVLRNGAYANAYGFFFPQRFPVSFRFEGTRLLRGSRVDVVEVSPAGLNPIQLWIDEKSHFIMRIAYEDGEPDIELSDYRKVGGVTVPFVATDGTSTFRTETVSFEQDGAVSFSPVTLH